MYTDVAPDMVLNLEKFVDKFGAGHFLKRFERALCVFSGNVSQLYASYEIQPLSEDYSRLVVMPDAYAFHDIFQSVTNEAVIKTGLYIIPGECVDESGLHLASVKDGKLKAMPLAAGIKKVEQQIGADEPFLPIIRNTDLKQFSGKHPVIHLHRLCLNKLNRLSSFQRRDMQLTIEEKVDQYLLSA